MATTVVNGVKLHYETMGDGDCVVMTHGSWTDASGWDQAATLLADRYRVLIWDRRGHSRSQAGSGPGSRAEDAADLAALIERTCTGRVHVVGNSYGANVTLTLLTTRPDLVTTVAVHEPPLWGLLEGTSDATLRDQLGTAEVELGVVRELISSGEHRSAAEHFVEHVALGPGMWSQLPEASRAVMEANAPTYLDELQDETALSIDTAALARADVPVLLTYGTDSPELFPAVTTELAELAPAAQVEVLEGAGHIPHITHTETWVARLIQFHEQQRRRSAARVS